MIWIFWVCCLSPVWYNIHCSLLMSQFDHQLQLVYSTWSIVQQDTSSTKLGKPLLTCSISHSTFSIHCTKFFVSVAFLLFLKWKNVICQNSFLISYIFQVATQKFTNFDMFFKNACWCQQLFQHNLTKLFLLKLRTTKCCLSIFWEIN